MGPESGYNFTHPHLLKVNTIGPFGVINLKNVLLGMISKFLGN